MPLINIITCSSVEQQPLRDTVLLTDSLTHLTFFLFFFLSFFFFNYTMFHYTRLLGSMATSLLTEQEILGSCLYSKVKLVCLVNNRWQAVSWIIRLVINGNYFKRRIWRWTGRRTRIAQRWSARLEIWRSQSKSQFRFKFFSWYFIKKIIILYLFITLI